MVSNLLCVGNVGKYGAGYQQCHQEGRTRDLIQKAVNPSCEPAGRTWFNHRAQIKRIKRAAAERACSASLTNSGSVFSLFYSEAKVIIKSIYKNAEVLHELAL